MAKSTSLAAAAAVAAAKAAAAAVATTTTTTGFKAGGFMSGGKDPKQNTHKERKTTTKKRRGGSGWTPTKRKKARRSLTQDPDETEDEEDNDGDEDYVEAADADADAETEDSDDSSKPKPVKSRKSQQKPHTIEKQKMKQEARERNQKTAANLKAEWFEWQKLTVNQRETKIDQLKDMVARNLNYFYDKTTEGGLNWTQNKERTQIVLIALGLQCDWFIPKLEAQPDASKPLDPEWRPVRSEVSKVVADWGIRIKASNTVSWQKSLTSVIEKFLNVLYNNDTKFLLPKDEKVYAGVRVLQPSFQSTIELQQHRDKLAESGSSSSPAVTSTTTTTTTTTTTKKKTNRAAGRAGCIVPPVKKTEKVEMHNNDNKNGSAGDAKSTFSNFQEGLPKSTRSISFHNALRIYQIQRPMTNPDETPSHFYAIHIPLPLIDWKHYKGLGKWPDIHCAVTEKNSVEVRARFCQRTMLGPDDKEAKYVEVHATHDGVDGLYAEWQKNRNHPRCWQPDSSGLVWFLANDHDHMSIWNLECHRTLYEMPEYHVVQSTLAHPHLHPHPNPPPHPHPTHHHMHDADALLGQQQQQPQVQHHPQQTHELQHANQQHVSFDFSAASLFSQPSDPIKSNTSSHHAQQVENAASLVVVPLPALVKPEPHHCSN